MVERHGVLATGRKVPHPRGTIQLILRWNRQYHLS
jgi:hypothetical protein